ncbi:hypothetical protein N7520_005608, partial [Penicillium odoratum]|uniref:uncharacterized protein n=1 Tax=Penicillium odoratum TaxID=1167516 RepID=UPI0025487FE8
FLVSRYNGYVQHSHSFIFNFNFLKFDHEYGWKFMSDFGIASFTQQKGNMLWNWNTVDSCFIAESWHITSKGMFAGSCIGVIFLVICLEFLRRLGKEYDRFLSRQHELAVANTESESSVEAFCPKNRPLTFTPSILQQSIRALLHMAQFAVAYIVMLLAMYFNGYIIICIFIGAYIGSFIFSWESISLRSLDLRRPGVSDHCFSGDRYNKQTSVVNETTVCCG